MQLENTGNKILNVKFYKEKVTLKFADEILDIPLDIFSSFYLYKGKVISTKELNEIKSQIAIYDLYKYAKKLTTKNLYSEYRIREKLYLKEANKKEVDEVINLLKKASLINDDLLVEEYVRLANEKNIGKRKIIAKLQEKGIFNDKITNIDFPYKKELEKAYNQLNKLEKRYDKYNYKMKKDHIIKALNSLGFDLDIAFEVSEDIKSNSPKEELNKLNKDFIIISNKYKKRYEGYELKEKIIAALSNKGYKYKDINLIMEENYL